MVYPVSCTAVCYVMVITLFIKKVGVVHAIFLSWGVRTPRSPQWLRPCAALIVGLGLWARRRRPRSQISRSSFASWKQMLTYRRRVSENLHANNTELSASSVRLLSAAHGERTATAARFLRQCFAVGQRFVDGEPECASRDG